MSTESEHTKETLTPHMELMVHTLQQRMMQLIHIRTSKDHEIASITPNSHHRIQTLRRNRVIHKEKHHNKKMKKLLHFHMIFKHDVDLLLKRYTGLFKQATQVLTYLRGETPTPLPPQVIENVYMLTDFYTRYNALYRAVYEKNEKLHHMLTLMLHGPSTNESNSENSTNEEEHVPSIRFAPSTFHTIPHRLDAFNDYLPPHATASAAAAPSSSSGGTRRKRRNRCHRRTRRA